MIAFSRFEPWQFKYELKEVMWKINDILCDGKYYDEVAMLKETMLCEFSKEIEKKLDKIETFEKEFAKEFLKRVFKNKIIIITEIVFLAIVMIA